MPAPAVPSKEQLNVPKGKVKSFFWDKLPDQEVNQDTVWSEIGQRDVQLDEESISDLEQNFSAKPRVVTNAQPVKVIKTSMEPRKQNLMGIFIQQTRLPPDNILQKLLHMEWLQKDESGYNILLKCCPSPEEIETAKMLVEQNEGTVVEQLVTKLYAFPCLEQRLQNLIFMEEYKSSYEIVKNTFQTSLDFQHFVVNSRAIFALFRLMLTVGNFLNAGSTRGSATGIRLKTLHKFSDTRDNYGATLLQNVFRIAQKFEEGTEPLFVEEIQNFAKSNVLVSSIEELSKYKSMKPAIQLLYELCSRIKKYCYDDQVKLLKSLNDGFSELQQSIEKCSARREVTQDDQYPARVSEFVEQHGPELEHLTKMQQQCDKLFEVTRQKYAEKKANFEQFLEYFLEFSQQCLEAIRLNEEYDQR